jgi:protein gp37
MDLQWARDLRDKAKAHGTAFFFKQSAAYKPGQGADALGALYQEFPAAMRARG